MMKCKHIIVFYTSHEINAKLYFPAMTHLSPIGSSRNEQKHFPLVFESLHCPWAPTNVPSIQNPACDSLVDSHNYVTKVHLGDHSCKPWLLHLTQLS